MLAQRSKDWRGLGSARGASQLGWRFPRFHLSTGICERKRCGLWTYAWARGQAAGNGEAGGWALHFCYYLAVDSLISAEVRMPPERFDYLGLPVIQPPPFCEYSAGPCDQSFDGSHQSDVFFLYPSDPPIIATTVEEAIRTLRLIGGDKRWIGWKDLGTTGQIIFCQICKALRFTKMVVADVTTLNFNLLFEIGYSIGLRVPVLPIRDTSFQKDQRIFDELGSLDTYGYLDFQNSSSLAEEILRRDTAPAFSAQIPAISKDQPLFVMKSHVHNDGMIKLMSALKKSGLRFRSFDPRETPRLSLHDAFKQVFCSMGVIVHLLAPHRVGATAHNARCAFVAGLAMAAGRRVLMLQESSVSQPIDYRDVVRSYSDASVVPDLLIPLIRDVVESLQETQFVPVILPLRPLEKIDLGDLAAENEIKGLGSYFVPTAQYNEAKRGHARLVVGRKGAGKTAIFYSVRSAYKPSRAHLVLDLKPEGHQFTKLREVVLRELTPGLQQHVLTAFWNYLLLMEIAHKIVNDELRYAFRDSRLKDPYDRVAAAYGADPGPEQGDFSERLLKLVDDIVNRRKEVKQIVGTPGVTQIVYGHDIRPLNDALSDYLAAARKEDVWLLFDNIDKGWPVLAATPEDIILLKSLLEATRKLQRQFEQRQVEFHVLVFIRNDIYQHLLLDPADRGKETPVLLDWNDPEVFKEILRRRIVASTGINEAFDVIWPHFFTTHVNGEESFSYMLNRTLMRPREVLRFVRESIGVAVNRGHERVTDEDIKQAETTCSEDLLVDLTLELKDVNTAFADVPYAFIGKKALLAVGDVESLLKEAHVPAGHIEGVLALLLWFGFLGIYVFPDEERYSYQFQYDLKKMRSGVKQHGYCVHSAFRNALGCPLQQYADER